MAIFSEWDKWVMLSLFAALFLVIPLKGEQAGVYDAQEARLDYIYISHDELSTLVRLDAESRVNGVEWGLCLSGKPQKNGWNVTGLHNLRRGNVSSVSIPCIQGDIATLHTHLDGADYLSDTDRHSAEAHSYPFSCVTSWAHWGVPVCFSDSSGYISAVPVFVEG